MTKSAKQAVIVREALLHRLNFLLTHHINNLMEIHSEIDLYRA